jgi:hypothetical protein
MSLLVVDKRSGVTWRMSDESFDEVVLERDGAVTRHTLAASADKRARPIGDAALMIDFADYRLQLLLHLEDDRLHVQLSPLGESHRFKIKGMAYPRQFELPRTADAYLVLPFQSGMILPGDWPREVTRGELWPFQDEARLRTYGELFDRDVDWWSSYRPGYAPALEPNLIMPWWGAVQPGGSFLALLDEDCWADTHLLVEHPAGGPSDYRLLWLPSRGHLSDPRRITLRFFAGGDYGGLARAYREEAAARGKCVTLREKNEKNPTIDRLMGTPNAILSFLHHDNRRFVHRVNLPFADAAGIVEAFHEKTGIDRLHVHLRSWQRGGHDIFYPDLTPPAPDAGGPVDFDRMVTALQQRGDLVCLSGDNYHDVALDSPLFDESMLLRYANGGTNRRNYWASGLTSLICTDVALKYLRNNFEVGRTDYPATKGLLETAHPDSYWIGNYISSYECYDERHPMTRNTCWDAQRRIFQYINDRGLLLNNEHPKDWAAPYFYMARTRQEREGVYGYDRSGDVLGVPVPLWSLVYHDCLITGGDYPLLQMLNGSPPSIDVQNCDEFTVNRTKAQAALHRVVGYEVMEEHRFLTDDRRVQQTTFANGVSVWIDESTQRCRITGVDGIPDEEFDASLASSAVNYY